MRNESRRKQARNISVRHAAGAIQILAFYYFGTERERSAVIPHRNMQTHCAPPLYREGQSRVYFACDTIYNRPFYSVTIDIIILDPIIEYSVNIRTLTPPASVCFCDDTEKYTYNNITADDSRTTIGNGVGQVGCVCVHEVGEVRYKISVSFIFTHTHTYIHKSVVQTTETVHQLLL